MIQFISDFQSKIDVISGDSCCDSKHSFMAALQKSYISQVGQTWCQSFQASVSLTRAVEKQSFHRSLRSFVRSLFCASESFTDSFMKVKTYSYSSFATSTTTPTSTRAWVTNAPHGPGAGYTSSPCQKAKLVHMIKTEIYNRLPIEVRNSPSRGSFKQKVKKWCIEHAFDKFDDITNMKVIQYFFVFKLNLIYIFNV